MRASNGFLNKATQSDPLIIAEISSNHNGDLSRARELISRAAAAGANAVKFQLFEIERLFSPEILEASAEHRARKSWELPRDFIPTLAADAHKLGLLFGCTPFDLDAARFLTTHVDFLKIASYELLWDDLIYQCGSSGIPVVLSTGMATHEEVAHAVEVVKRSKCTDFALLHCVSSYPAPKEETNLSAIRTMHEFFGVPAGWSDHTNDSSVVLRAIERWGATIIELHFDLDGQGHEVDAGHCWLPENLLYLTQRLKNAKLLDGDGVKKPTLAELSDVAWRADPTDGLRPLKTKRQSLWTL